jgi:hypothetical protein
MDATKYTYWRGQYRHVNYEIVSWNITDRAAWAAYITTNSEQIKLSYSSRIIGRDTLIQSFDGEPILMALNDSTHGGITLYEVATSPGTDTERYRIGWDYQHLWDEYVTYDATGIYGDVVKAIDALWNIAPDMKVWCSTVGGWHSLKDGYVTSEGAFISREGHDWRVENGYKPLEIEA